MNRSVLVAGLVLIHQGMSAEDAIDRVRERQQGSLSDEYADWLRGEGARADDVVTDHSHSRVCDLHDAEEVRHEPSSRSARR
jgi:hypothetical protein